MSTTLGLPPNAAEYLEALRAELADLAPEERDDLLSEVEPSLLDAAADSDEPLAARLGPPAHFAADLRASAGLPAAAPKPPERAGFGSALRELAAHRHLARTLAVLRELAPVWWIVRAYVAVEMLAIAIGEGAERSAQITRYPELPRIGGAGLGLLVLALALAASIAAGIAARRQPDRWRRTRIAANVLLVVLAFPVAAELKESADVRASTPTVVVDPAPVSGLAYEGNPINNVYAYDRNGKLLHDVRLYDSFGTPLDIGANAPDENRRPVRDASGGELFNAFPIRYFEPGTQRVAKPNAGAPVSPPRITTSPP
jgi:HAAS domain-containing protein